MRDPPPAVRGESRAPLLPARPAAWSIKDLRELARSACFLSFFFSF
jgi:hypothetical protein